MHICTYNWARVCWSELNKIGIPLRREGMDIDNSSVVDSGSFDWCGHQSGVDVIGRHGECG